MAPSPPRGLHLFRPFCPGKLESVCVCAESFWHKSFGFGVTCKHTKGHNGVHLRVGERMPSWTHSVLARLERPVGAILNDLIWKWNHGDRWNDRSGAVINHISFCGVGLGWGLDGKETPWLEDHHDGRPEDVESFLARADSLWGLHAEP